MIHVDQHIAVIRGLASLLTVAHDKSPRARCDTMHR